MTTDDQPADREGSLLARLSTEMVRAQKEHYGKGPTRAKSYMLDDFLIIVMRGGTTVAERTMLDADQEDLVRQFRQTFENEIGAKLIGMVEELTGRKVLTYQSQILFDPDVIFEIFMFDAAAEIEQVRETARGQLDDGETGEVRGADVVDESPG